MNVGNTLQIFLLVVSIVLIILTIIVISIWFTDNSVDIANMNDSEEMIIRTAKKIIVTGSIALFIGLLIPSKETCIEMMIASQVTHENISTTKEEIYKVIDYITDKVNGEEKEK
jgi:uncharacterized protein YacL